MNWEQGREGPGGSVCSVEVKRTEQRGGRAAGRAQGRGDHRAGRKAVHIRAPGIPKEAWGCVDGAGDAALC